MAAFFIISGYCSSFEKEFRSFFVSNFKGLILQSVSIVAFIGILLFAVTWDLESFRLGWFTSLRSGGLFWFVLTLFCCKVLFWIQKKYICRDYIIWLINITFMIMASILYHSKVPEVFNIYHSFALIIFVQLGVFLNEKKLLESKMIIKISMLGYVIGLIFFVISGVKINNCSIIATWIFAPCYIPLFLLLSTTGSILILFISRFIGKSAFFSYYGKGSLSVYLLHLIIWPKILLLFSDLLCSSNNIIEVIVFILLYLFCIIICGLFIRLLDLPYIRVIKLDFRDFVN